MGWVAYCHIEPHQFSLSLYPLAQIPHPLWLRIAVEHKYRAHPRPSPGKLKPIDKMSVVNRLRRLKLCKPFISKVKTNEVIHD